MRFLRAPNFESDKFTIEPYIVLYIHRAYRMKLIITCRIHTGNKRDKIKNSYFKLNFGILKLNYSIFDGADDSRAQMRDSQEMRKENFILRERNIYLFSKEGTIINMMYPVDVAIRKRVGNACMVEHTARIRFDPYRRPAAYSSISHGTRVVGRVTLHFVSTDYFRHNSVCTDGRCDATRRVSASDHHSTLDDLTYTYRKS